MKRKEKKVIKVYKLKTGMDVLGNLYNSTNRVKGFSLIYAKK